MRLRGFSSSRSRIIEVSVILGLLLLGNVLPYLWMPYVTPTIETTTYSGPLFPAAQFIGGVDPLWLPDYDRALAGDVNFAINVFGFGLSVPQVATVVAVVTVWCLFQDEINKFFWWPLHLAGWALVLAVVPLIIGLVLVHQIGVSLTLGPAFVFVTLAGIAIIWRTLKHRERIDTYASI